MYDVDSSRRERMPPAPLPALSRAAAMVGKSVARKGQIAGVSVSMRWRKRERRKVRRLEIKTRNGSG